MKWHELSTKAKLRHIQRNNKFEFIEIEPYKYELYMNDKPYFDYDYNEKYLHVKNHIRFFAAEGNNLQEFIYSHYDFKRLCKLVIEQQILYDLAFSNCYTIAQKYNLNGIEY